MRKDDFVAVGIETDRYTFVLASIFLYWLVHVYKWVGVRFHFRPVYIVFPIFIMFSFKGS